MESHGPRDVGHLEDVEAAGAGIALRWRERAELLAVPEGLQRIVLRVATAREAAEGLVRFRRRDVRHDRRAEADLAPPLLKPEVGPDEERGRGGADRGEHPP